MALSKANDSSFHDGSQTHHNNADEAHVRDALRVVLEPSSVAELRVPSTHRGTVSGYFDDFSYLALAAAKYSGAVPGVYITLNPVNPTLLARAKNRTIAYAKHTTSDEDIVHRRWIPVDLDSVRPSGISSTDGEHQAALDRARELQAFLVTLGFLKDSTVLADSGNGGHVLIRVDLPNDSQTIDLVQKCLRTLDLHFTDANVHVDLTTYNAARLIKVYGTLAAKGDSTAERPHRLSRLLQVPDRIVAAPQELLEQLADLAPHKPKPEHHTGKQEAFDLEQWIARHKLPVVASGTWGQGWKWILNPCPWNREHTNRSAYIVRHANGAIAAGCHHYGCAGNGWHELRDLYEPGWRSGGASHGPLPLDGGDGSDANPSEASRRAGQLPVIIVTERHMREITSDALRIMQNINGPTPSIFTRGSHLSRLRHTNGRGPWIEPLSDAALKGYLDRLASFMKKKKNGYGEIELNPARPPDDVIRDILSLPSLPFPEIRRLAEIPVLLLGGRFLTQEGYDSESGVYLQLDGLEQVSPTMPLSDAVSLLLGDLLVDFCFVNNGSRAHALACLLQSFVTPVINGPSPLYLFDAPRPGEGKDLLVAAIATVVTGHTASVTTQPGDADEFRKRITALLLEGHQFLLVDNVKALRSSTLAACLTSEWWQDRLLGQTKTVRVRNDAIWLATGNNVLLSDEMARRTIPIRLDSGLEFPELRTDFKHDPLLEWVQNHRADLVRACLSIVRAWVDAGMPKSKARLGMFEGWAGVLGGILEVAGVPGFLSGREYLYGVADQESSQWRSLCQVWWCEYAGNAVTAGDLFHLVKERKLLLELWAGRSDLGAMQRLGNALHQHRDRVYDQWAIREAGRDSQTGNLAYRLEKINKQFCSGGDQTPETPETPAFVSDSDGCFESKHPSLFVAKSGVSGVSGVSSPTANKTAQPSETTSEGGRDDKDPWDDFLGEVADEGNDQS